MQQLISSDEFKNCIKTFSCSNQLLFLFSRFISTDAQTLFIAPFGLFYQSKFETNKKKFTLRYLYLTDEAPSTTSYALVLGRNDPDQFCISLSISTRAHLEWLLSRSVNLNNNVQMMLNSFKYEAVHIPHSHLITILLIRLTQIT